MGENLEFKVLLKSNVKIQIIWPKEIQEKANQLGNEMQPFFVLINSNTVEINREELDEVKYVNETEYLEILKRKYQDKAEELINEYNSLKNKF